MEDNIKVENRIQEALDIRGMKQIYLADATGISRGTVNNWIKQKYQPKQKGLMAMAKVLKVSEMWLAGYDVPMERPAAQIKGDKISDIVKELRESDRLVELVSKLPSLTDSQLVTIETLLTEFSKLNQNQANS